MVGEELFSLWRSIIKDGCLMADIAYIRYREFPGPLAGSCDVRVPMSEPATGHQHRADNFVPTVHRTGCLLPEGAQPGYPAWMNVIDRLILKEVWWWLFCCQE